MFCFVDRSQGNRGASVEILRGSRGAEFEGQARVIRGEAWGNCGGCIMNEDDDELAEKHLLIKGPFCFVFYEDDDLSPRYAIPLEKMKGIVRDTIKGMTVVTLERKGEVEYEVSFDNINLAKDFRDAVAKQAASVRAENYAKVRNDAISLLVTVAGWLNKLNQGFEYGGNWLLKSF